MTESEVRELLKGEFDLIIPNFEKWNPDTRHRRNWFALSVDWFLDPKIAKLTMPQQAAWIKLLAIYASRRSHLYSTSTRSVAQAISTRSSVVAQLLVKCLKLGLIDLRCVSLHNKTRHDITRQTEVVVDKQDRTTAPPPPSPDQKPQDAPKGKAVIPELAGVDDDFFGGMNQEAQKSWLKEYGVELIRTHAPTFISLWDSDRPTDRYGRLRPKILFVKNHLAAEKKKADQPMPWSGDGPPRASESEIRKALAEVWKK